MDFGLTSRIVAGRRACGRSVKYSSGACVMKQWAITVGINQYHWFQPLSYAQRDAQALQSFLVDEAGVAPDRCLLLTDTSPPIQGRPTYPNRENIEGWIDLISRQGLQPGDVLWYFFSGYGVCHHGRDYLMPIDGNPHDLDSTAIPLEVMFDRLKTVPAETMLVLLDMNRSEGALSYETVGAQTAALAGHAGIPTILSCQPDQFSREASALGHGFFTAALLESLRYPQCATLDHLNKYLGDRLPELSEHHWRPTQTPVTISPPEKLQQLILPGVSQPIWTPSRRENGAQPHRNGSSVQPRREAYSLAFQNGSSQYQNGASQNGSFQNGASIKQEAPPARQIPELNGEYLQRVKPPVSNPPMANGSPIRPGEHPSERSSISNAAPEPENGHSSIESDIESGIEPDRAAPVQERSPVQETAKLSTPPPPPPPVATAPKPEDPEDEIPDAVFWRPMQKWGGLAVTVLLVGVLLRNWTAMTQGTSSAPLIVAKPSTSAVALAPQTELPPSTPSQSPQSAAVGTLPETNPAAGAATQGQASGQTVATRPTGLAAAQMAIKPLKAAPQGSFAAKSAGSTAESQLPIPAPVPAVKGAAAAVSPAVKQQGTLSAKPAGTAAQGQAPTVTPNSASVPVAKPPLKAPPVSSSALAKAKAKLTKAPTAGEASRLGYAIREASKIRPGQPDYPQAQQAIAGWSQEILTISRQRASQQKFDTAILAIALVPQNQPIYPQARASLKQWCKAVYLQRITNPIQQRQARDFCRTQVSPLP